MKVGEKAESYLVAHFAFPLTNFLFNRRKILSRYDDLSHTEWYEPERMRDLQLHKLRRLIAYAYDRIPFYRSRFQAEGLLPGDINSLEDITKIPPLSRQEVIDHRHDMVDSAFAGAVAAADRSKRSPGEPIPFAPFRRHKLVRNTSSGSTGAPTVFYEDGSRTALNWTLEMRLKSWFDVPPGAREARMVRLSTEYMPASRTIRLRNRLWNQLIIPGVNLTDADYAICVQKLDNFRPKVLWGFTSALSGLAEYLRRKGVDPSPWGVRLITGWAAPVYDHERNVLQEVFSCPVSNIYSAREVGHVAGQCSHGAYHVNQEHSLVERDESPVEAANREAGELLVTTLDISPMPFIRYRMGDIGRTADSACGCGRKLQVLQDLMGRTGEVFRTRDGRMISPNFWCRTFMNTALSDAIKRFQVVYIRDDLMRIRIVKGEVYSEATERVLREHLKKNFPRDMTFEFAYVQEIKPQVSGKYQMVVNEIR
jgi:phenylacetate-CoA ligase